jgi:hypothetical protein
VAEVVVVVAAAVVVVDVTEVLKVGVVNDVAYSSQVVNQQKLKPETISQNLFCVTYMPSNIKLERLFVTNVHSTHRQGRSLTK